MLKLKAAAFGAMTLVLFSGALAVGQDRGGDPRGGKKDDAKIEKKADQPAAPAVLSDKDVGELLKKLGYTPEVHKLPPNDALLYLVKIEHKGLTVSLNVERSVDGSKVYLSVWFKPLEKDEQIPSDVLVKMLEANSKFGPCHFSMLGQARQLYLAMPLDNRNLTPEEVQRQIGVFLNVVAETEPIWNSAKWAPPGGGGR
jgi:hypothetical protein